MGSFDQPADDSQPASTGEFSFDKPLDDDLPEDESTETQTTERTESTSSNSSSSEVAGLNDGLDLT